jgi:hypothetical protein
MNGQRNGHLGHLEHHLQQTQTKCEHHNPFLDIAHPEAVDEECREPDKDQFSDAVGDTDDEPSRELVGKT